MNEDALGCRCSCCSVSAELAETVVVLARVSVRMAERLERAATGLGVDDGLPTALVGGFRMVHRDAERIQARLAAS